MIYLLITLISLANASKSGSGKKIYEEDKYDNHGSLQDKYDVVIIGGGFSGLYTAMRLGQANHGSLKIAIVEKNIHNENWQGSGYSHNGIKEIYPDQQYQHACLGGRLQDYPFECEIDEANNPHCPSDGEFPGIVWFGDHAMRYKSSTGNFYLAEEFGIQEIHSDPHYTYGEAEGFMGHDRGYYFMGGQELLDNKYADDFKYGNLVSDDWAELFMKGFESDHLRDLCDEENNKWHHIRSYYANITGSSSGIELMEGTIRFKSTWTDVDAQGMMEWIDTDLKSDEGWAVYPEQGGMSEFVRAMYKIIIENDYADIYCGYNVDGVELNQYISHGNDNSDGKYRINKKCENNDDMYNNKKQDYLYGDKLIVTVPITALKEMNGLMAPIADDVHSDLWNPIDVVTCSQQFETDWYSNLVPKQYPLQKDIKVEDIKVDTWFSKENCVQQIENFNSDYLRSANVIRSLYVDESKCYNFWASLIEGSDYDYDGVIADEIRARHAEYFGLDYEDIPPALKTRCEISAEAWHHVAPMASYKIGNNIARKVEEWAMKPLDNHDIHMCGETWTIRHAWSDGCRAHCDVMMNEYFDVDEEYLPQWDFSLHTRGVCSSVCGDDGSTDDECVKWPDRAILKDSQHVNDDIL